MSAFGAWHSVAAFCRFAMNLRSALISLPPFRHLFLSIELLKYL